MITFEKIRDLERAERDNKQLQKLTEGLTDDIKDYLKRKEIALKSSMDILELENVKNTIKRLFELREKKMLDMALYTVRTGLPPENLSTEEERIFYTIVEGLKNYRESFFARIHKEEQKDEIIHKPEIMRHAEPKIAQESVIESSLQDIKMEELEEENFVFKVKKTVPQFVGPDMKIYRLQENEIVDLPKSLNDLLLKEGFIERVKVEKVKAE